MFYMFSFMWSFGKAVPPNSLLVHLKNRFNWPFQYSILSAPIITASYTRSGGLYSFRVHFTACYQAHCSYAKFEAYSLLLVTLSSSMFSSAVPRLCLLTLSYAVQSNCPPDFCLTCFSSTTLLFHLKLVDSVLVCFRLLLFNVFKFHDFVVPS